MRPAGKPSRTAHPCPHFLAAVLHLLGIDQERLTYYHKGIMQRLTNVQGPVIRPILS